MSTHLAAAGGERHSSEGTRSASRVSASRRLYGLLQNRPGIILSPLSFGLLLVLWEFVSRAGLVAPIILPPPTRVWDGLVILFTAPWFPQHVWLTTAETLIGFAIGGVGAILLGIAMVNMPLFKEVVYPYVVAFQVMPKVVLAPIFITWFGLGIESKIVMAIAISFFPVVINTVVGLESVEENAMLLMRSLVASRRQVFWKLAWPAALPSIFAGLKTSLTLALIGALVAEFVTAKDGLGTLIITFSFELKVYLVFAVIVVVSVLGLALYGIMEYLDRKVVFWRQSHFTG
jgi:NitT/TauT family transport system permease protein